MRFGKEKEVEIFKALAQKSTYQVGLDFGFDKVYKDSRAVRNAVTSIFNKVKNNQSEYGISNEVLEVVQNGMALRKQSVVGSPTSLREKQEVDIKDLVTNIRDKAFVLIDKKLDRISNNKKKLDEVSFKELGTIAGISFDKTQILKGEATEHIAVLAKVDTNISADEALKLALQSRENNVDVNTNRG